MAKKKELSRNQFQEIYEIGEPKLLYEFVEKKLRGSDYGLGSVEAVTAEAENVKEAFCRLIEVLYDSNVIKKCDVYYITSKTREGK